MEKVLFVCVHNSARSQIAETYLNDFGKSLFIAESAGIEKGQLNPYVIEVMAEDGYDISNNSVNSVFDYYKEGRRYTYVVKVCDEINGQRCPVFPHALKDIYWNLEDPAAYKGSKEEILEKTRQIRDVIKNKVLEFIKTYEDHAKSRNEEL